MITPRQFEFETNGGGAYHYHLQTSNICWDFALLMKFNVLLFSWVFWSLQTRLLCIVGDVSGGGSVAMAVGNNDRWHVTGERCDSTHDTEIRQMAQDNWNMNHYLIYFIHLFFGGKWAFFVCFCPQKSIFSVKTERKSDWWQP